MNRQLLFAFLPKSYLLFLAVGLALRTGSEVFLALSTAIINVVLALLCLKLAIFIHESGHLAMARFVGGVPRRMILGKGHEIARWEYQGIKVIVTSKINSGLAFAAFPDPARIRFRLLAYTGGGSLFNFLVAILLTFGFGAQFNIFDNSQVVSFLTALNFSNLIMGIVALVPGTVDFNGQKLASDGSSILKIPFHTEEKLSRLSLTSDLLDGLDLLESKQYEQAIRLYEDCLQRAPDFRAIKIDLAIAHLKLGDLDRSLDLLRSFEEEADQEELALYGMYLYNALAWNFLLTSELEKADKYSQLAIEAAPKNENVKGTRASVLIELGQLEEGKKLIQDSVDFRFANDQTLTAAMYLGFVYHLQNDPEAGRKYHDFVDAHIDLLAKDELLLYARIRGRMDQPGSGK